MLENEADICVQGEAASAEEALEKLKQISPNIVLMDIKMGAVDGLKATEIIRRLYPEFQ